MSDAAAYSFHAVVHARPVVESAGGTVAVRNLQLAALNVRPDDALAGFGATFEEVEAAYSCEPRLFFEPDGSFVWRSAADEPTWQLDGVVYDRDGRVRYIDLKGTCPPARLDALLAPLGWPRQAVMFQLAREAVFLAEAEFRTYAAAGR